MTALRFVGLFASLLVFGLTLGHVLQSPGSRALDPMAWLQVQHTFYGGFAIVGGAAEIVGVLATAAEAIARRRDPRTALAPAVAAGCLLGTLLSYWFGNRPVNAAVAAWTPSTLPVDWTRYRDTWETAHAISAVLSGIATVVLLVTTLRSQRLTVDAPG